MAKKKKIDLIWYIVLIALVIIAFVWMINIPRDSLYGKNVTESTNITTENDSSINLEINNVNETLNITNDEIVIIVADNITNRDDPMYAAGCWCQGATHEYWTNDCPCPVKEAVEAVSQIK